MRRALARHPHRARAHAPRRNSRCRNPAGRRQDPRHRPARGNGTVPGHARTRRAQPARRSWFYRRAPPRRRRTRRHGGHSGSSRRNRRVCGPARHHLVRGHHRFCRRPGDAAQPGRPGRRHPCASRQSAGGPGMPGRAPGRTVPESRAPRRASSRIFDPAVARSSRPISRRSGRLCAHPHAGAGAARSGGNDCGSPCRGAGGVHGPHGRDVQRSGARHRAGRAPRRARLQRHAAFFPPRNRSDRRW